MKDPMPISPESQEDPSISVEDAPEGHNDTYESPQKRVATQILSEEEVFSNRKEDRKIEEERARQELSKKLSDLPSDQDSARSETKTNIVASELLAKDRENTELEEESNRTSSLPNTESIKNIHDYQRTESAQEVLNKITLGILKKYGITKDEYEKLLDQAGHQSQDPIRLNLATNEEHADFELSDEKMKELGNISREILEEQKKQGRAIMIEMGIPTGLSELLTEDQRAYFPVKRLTKQGNMSQVIEMIYLPTGQPVIVKFLLSNDPEHQGRFEREGVIAADAEKGNPNIVSILDAEYNHYDKGGAFMIMRKAEGPDLEVEVRKNGPFPEDEVIEIGIEIANALAPLHAKGLIHRDIKPDNIIVHDEELTYDSKKKIKRTYKLADFGLVGVTAREMVTNQEGDYFLAFDSVEDSLEDLLADLVEDRSEISDVSPIVNALNIAEAGLTDDAIVGTPLYMSPEQIKSNITDPRSDIYSLGATLFRILTNRTTVESPTLEGGKKARTTIGTLKSILKGETLSLVNLVKEKRVQGVSMEFAELIDQMQDQDYSKRPTTDELIIRLKALQRKNPSAP